MEKIRNNVFETNSSSTHVLCLPTEYQSYNKLDYVNFKYGEFGWEIDVYRDTESKASYLYTLLNYFENSREEYLETIKNYLDEEGITYDFEESSKSCYWEKGYVDHGEDGLDMIETILDNKNNFLKFLFDSRAYVFTSNDNEWDEDKVYWIPGDTDEENSIFIYKGN